MKTRSFNSKFILGLMVTFTTAAMSPAFAADYDDETMPAQPAELTDNKSSLQNQVQFPQIDEDISILLLCDGHIDRTGNFTGQVYCFRDIEIEDKVLGRDGTDMRAPNVGPGTEEVEVTTNQDDWYEERFEREVVEAARNSRLTPAKMDGKRVEVKINFAVLFEKEGSIENIEVFMHHFRNERMLGRDYIGAQRFSQQKRMFESSMPNECPALHIPVWIKSYIKDTGSAISVSHHATGRSSQDVSEESVNRCINAYSEMLEENLFVPIIYNGNYMTGQYIELFYDDPRDENAPVNTETRDRVVEEFQSRGGSIMDE